MKRTPGYPNALFKALTWFILILCAGCSLKVNRRALHSVSDLSTLEGLDGKAPWLKAHLPDGGLFLLSDWEVSADDRVIRGQGVRMNPRRDVIATDRFAVSLDSISIIESNVVQSSSAAAGLTVMTVASLGMTAYCIANPKACFGSCPTFYAPDESGRPLLSAEGFSASVAPALEDSDLDALFRTTAHGDRFTLVMTNEALETHVVRHADLLVAPRPTDGRVLALQDGTWRQARRLRPADRATGSEGDCTDLLRAADLRERYSLADSTYLATREFVDLTFDQAPAGSLGLVVTARHSLLSTYLFYQGLAYLGENAVPALGRLQPDSGGPEGSKAMGDLLGRIEIQMPDTDGAWRTVGAVGETGPLAVNTHTVPLPRPATCGPLRLRLKLTRGNWRLDQVALCELGTAVVPTRLAPVLVRRGDTGDPDALADLLDGTRTLISQPGDRFDLVYDLPDPSARYDVFLESRGYYLEWMRESWLAEEDPAMAALMFRKPRLALAWLAPKFKELEPDMEAHFWGSCYAPQD